MRIGILSSVDPRDAGAISGVPFHTSRELARLGEVVDLVPLATARGPRTAGLRGLVPPRLRQAARSLLSPAAAPPPTLSRTARTRDEVLTEATRLSRLVGAQVARHRVDVLFGYGVSWLLYALETDLPLVYATDTTARLMRGSYWGLSGRTDEYMDACDLLERVALERAAESVFPTALARRSALEHYGVAPGRAHVVPLGANIAPPRPLDRPAPVAPPSREDLRILFVGFDPERKRLDLAVEAVAALRAAGWAARLDVIGRPTPLARRSPWVTLLGLLDLASAADGAIHRRAIERSHLLLLPSEAEAFGIAPCDAAQFGRPSVVSSAGGLPEVVVHGETGLVLPVRSGPAEFARAILDLVEDPAVHRRACEAALRRAQGVLSWDRWRAGVRPILERAIGGRDRPPLRAASA